MTELSIVVIIYKVEKYLRQCLDSILRQRYTDYELILVDDGSPDACPEICDEYASRDDRIKVIHQRNQGAAMARWNGILAAKGRYISLLDSDDWLEEDMYEHMMQLALENDADLVIVGYRENKDSTETEKSNRISSGNYGAENIQEIYQRALYDNCFYEPGIIPAVWNKLIRRDLFFDRFTPADAEIRMGEDAAITYPAIAKAQRIIIDNEFRPYHYRIIQGSLSRSYDARYFERAIKLLTGLKKNCSCNTEMTKDLSYYGLFISLLGIYSLFSKDCSYSLKQKSRIMRDYMDEYHKIGLDPEIQWDDFNDEFRTLMKAFYYRNHYGVIRSIYTGKVKAKIKRIWK